MMHEPCETCEDSGYVWREGPDGKSWMCDCDDEDCNAFSQLDENEENLEEGQE